MTGVRESFVVAKKTCGLPPMCGWYMKAQAARRRVPQGAIYTARRQTPDKERCGTAIISPGIRREKPDGLKAHRDSI